MTDPARTPSDVIDRLAATIASRRGADAATSYVAALFAKGRRRHPEEGRRGSDRDGHGGEGR